MMSPTASRVTCRIGVVVAVGLGDANGEGLKGKGDGAADAMGAGIEEGRERVAGRRLDGFDLPPVQALRPRLAIKTHTAKILFFIVILNFQLHFPDGLQ
jgi:hypothetical protein